MRSASVNLLYVLTAVGAIVVAQFGPRSAFQLVKGFPIIILLMALGWSAPDLVADRMRKWRLAGLSASLVGAVVLERFFDIGTVAFVLAQLCYCLSIAWRSVTTTSLVIAGAVASSTFVAMTRLVLSSVPSPLQELVVLYAFVEALVITGALGHWWSARRDKQAIFMGAGVWLFAISDCLLAINKWKIEILGAEIWIQVCYFAGQYLIARSAVHNLRIAFPSRSTGL